MRGFKNRAYLLWVVFFGTRAQAAMAWVGARSVGRR